MTHLERVGRTKVFIVDDDGNLLKALDQCLSAAGWDTESFASIAEFEARIQASEPGILLLDYEFPNENGLELQTRMVGRDDRRPIVFMTGRDEVPLAVKAMKGGAFDYLVKPFSEEALFEVVVRASKVEESRQQSRFEIESLKEAFESLTPRERQVMAHVVAGKLNKQIAGEMLLAEVTVKVHRSRMMQKMKASSVSVLVRLHDRLFGS